MTRACVAARAPTAPRVRPPPGSCDTHAHVLGPFDRYPLAATRPYTPPPATVDDLAAMLDRMGLDRVVVAHVSAHGYDLSVTLDALRRLGARARGVAMLAPEVDDGRLSDLHALGIRGMRLSHAYGQGHGLDEAAILRWADRIAALGWHLATWPTTMAEFKTVRRVADRLVAPLVIDHLGNHAWDPAGGLQQPGVRCVEDLLRSGRVWLKLSAPYRADASGAPWSSLGPIVERFIDVAPDRMLWARDWPHVGLWADDDMPGSGDLLDWFFDRVDDVDLRQRILVRNPEALYGFDRTGR